MYRGCAEPSDTQRLWVSRNHHFVYWLAPASRLMRLPSALIGYLATHHMAGGAAAHALKVKHQAPVGGPAPERSMHMSLHCG